jgi:hypothetical protein
MTRRRRKLAFGAMAVTVPTSLAVLAWHCLAGWSLPTEYAAVGHPPRIRPDYTQVVMPPNIAPLNFLVEEPGVEYRVRIYGTAGEDIIVGSRHPSIVIPPRPWRELLSRNRGGRILFEIYARGEDGRWSRFSAISNGVAREKIDSHLVYRLLGPVCNLYRTMGIYQRNLENYDESAVVTHDEVDACFNCHAFSKNRPDTFSFQVRRGRAKERIESGMIVVRGGHAFRLQTESRAAPRPPGYTSWHPGGAVAAFSMSRPYQLFRGAGADVREVFDTLSDIAIVDVQTGAASTSPGVADPGRLETLPGWSADGRILYYSSAESPWGADELPTAEAVAKTKYDLMCVRYDVEKAAWGKPEIVLSATKTGKSISEPRASPDGRHLLFCISDRGAFPVHEASSDLCLMDVKSRNYRRLECNSRQSDSWHCWSSNSRWIVFSSKRDNPLLARLYFSYIDEDGRERKPFLLPQKDPTFYDTWLKTYNVPELISGPIVVSRRELQKAIHSTSAAGKSPQKPIPAAAEDYPIN